MKFDVISTVVMVFCVGVCITLAADAETLFGSDAPQAAVTQPH